MNTGENVFFFGGGGNETNSKKEKALIWRFTLHKVEFLNLGQIIKDLRVFNVRYA